MVIDHSMKMSPSFRWHNVTQFFGALNDNVYRWLMVFFLIGLQGKEKAAEVTSFSGVVFVMPFLIFTPFAGIIADRCSKRNIIVLAKIAELIIMLMGWAVFSFYSHLGSGAIWGVYAVLFMMCAQSAFFGPCKYGILPEIVHRDQISKANSFIEGMTYLSVVIGTAFAPWLSDLLGRNFALASISCVLFAVIGMVASFFIMKTPRPTEQTTISLLPWGEFAYAMKSIKHDRDLILAMLAAAYFMLIGGFSQINLIPYGMAVCGYTDIQSGYLFLVAAVAIGLGSWFAGRLSGRNVELGIVPLGAIGMAVGAMGLGIIPFVLSPEHILIPVFLLIFVFGLSCGLFIVPIHSFIQLRAPESVRGRVIAASSFIGWIGVLGASGLVFVFTDLLNVPSSVMFLALGALTLLLATIAIWMLPDFLVRLIVVLITRIMYKIRVQGDDNIPDGPALIISNHVSWADAVVIGATQQRRIRFIMDREFYKLPGLNWLFRLQKVIPISASDPPKKIVAALKEARQALDEGYLVCIFAEGMLTRTGLLGRFHEGFGRIVKGTNYPIIPTYLGGLWGSIFSYYHGKLMTAWPRRLPCPVSVLFGKPLPAEASTREIRWAIEELSVEYFNERKSVRHSLGETFVKAARRNWSKPFVSDATGKRMSFGTALIAATAMADLLKDKTEGQASIGILLPPSVGGALANLTAALLNKASVNLSYTASEADREYMMQAAGVKTVLTSRTFLEKTSIDASKLAGVLFIEDLIEQLIPKVKRSAAIKALLLPRRRLANVNRSFSSEQTAVVLFSSGSSGRPKGVELSHHNVQSNLEAALMVFRAYPSDKLCGVLPFFHSFGLTCTLWLPIIAGVPVCYVPNPLDGKLVGQTIRQERATLLFATPTFLLNYYRRCEKEDFASIRFIIAGAEKFKVKLMDAFEEKFGVRPREGYGATECSPLIALNVLDAEFGGIKQVGTRDGSVGHTLPGMAVRVLHPETGEPVETGQPGLLYVKGPSVMKAYLKLPEKTAEVLKDGWYNTGDIVSIDEDGFVTIHDRLSRFSKIGGEMVPHVSIEEAALNGLGTQEQLVAVTGVPEEKKGEKLVMLYVRDKVDPDKLYEILGQSGLPNLYIPKRENLIEVDELPRLGSGKIDIVRVRKIALEAENKQ